MNLNTVVCPLFHLSFPLLPSGFSLSVHHWHLGWKKLLQFWTNAEGTVMGNTVFVYIIKTHWWVCCITSIKSLSCLLMANTPELLLPKCYCCRCCKAKQCVRNMFYILKLFKGAQRGWLQIIMNLFSYFVFWCINY